MFSYLLRRLGQAVIVFFGATLLIYLAVLIYSGTLPGDPIAALSGGKPLSPAVIANLRAQYFLDQPFQVQYWHYIKGVFTLDFGKSFSGQPVSDVMRRAWPVTIDIALIALTVEAVFGVVFGVISGLKKCWASSGGSSRSPSAATSTCITCCSPDSCSALCLSRTWCG